MRLVNAEAAHRRYPRTFSIPRRATREALQPDDYVKLIFAVEPPANGMEFERMWVRVRHRVGGVFRGTLSNRPRFVADMAMGDEVEFGPEHVAAREAEPGDPLFIDDQRIALVSRHVWERDEWPDVLVHAELAEPRFTGWLVMTNGEWTAGERPFHRFVPVRIDRLFARFPVLDSGLEGGVGTMMRWNQDAVEYQEAQPSHPEPPG